MVNIYSSMETETSQRDLHMRIVHGLFPITNQLINIYLLKRLVCNNNYNLIVDIIIYYFNH
jgi:hypothetical protein